MTNSEQMIANLKRQRDLLNELVADLELHGSLTLEDYSYCESRADQLIRGLKEVRRAAVGEMIQGVVWFQDSSSL